MFADRKQLNEKSKECSEAKTRVTQMELKQRETEVKARTLQSSLQNGSLLQDTINQK